MKNVVIVILLLATGVTGYIAAVSRLRLSIRGVEGETEKIVRGDITIPITATGEIRPVLRMEVKSVASGEVIEIAKHPGDRVKVGDLLIRLNPEDEQRSVARTRQDLQTAEARLETARIDLKLAETADLDNARSQVEQLAATLELAKYRWVKFNELDPKLRNEEEVLQRDTEYRRQLAQWEGTKAAYEKAKLAIPRAAQTLKQAEAFYESAKSTMADAEKRLAETDIVSPINGIVGDIRTQIGEVIQGGKTTLTGGTVLAVLMDLTRIAVRAEIDESEIGRVLDLAPAWAKPGHENEQSMPADLKSALSRTEHPPVITVEAFRDLEFPGIIERIFPEPPDSRTSVITYRADVLIVSDNSHSLLSGMRADVRFTSEHASNVLLCPNEAIREGPMGQLGVYVPKPGSAPDERKTDFITCKFGLDNGNVSEVREGLEEGMAVYTKLPAKREDRESKNKKG